MNPLNIFSTNDVTRWYQVFSPRRLLNQLKWSKQRITRGFSDYDVYDLDEFYLELFKQSIEHFRVTSHSYPNDMTEEQWGTYLKEIVNHCRLSSIGEYENEYTKEYLEKCPVVFENEEETKEGWRKTKLKKSPEHKELEDAWFKRHEEIEAEAKHHKKRALEMITERFDNLWD